MEDSKKVIWMGNTLEYIRLFPEQVKDDIGHSLWKLQTGEKPNNYKPFAGLKKNAFEIRVSDKNGIYRVLYVTFVKNSIVVLHAFQKKTEKTSQKDKDIANERIKSLLQKGK